MHPKMLIENYDQPGIELLTFLILESLLKNHMGKANTLQISLMKKRLGRP